MSSENFSQDGPKGIIPYDLVGDFCGTCGRPKLNRLLHDGFGVQDCPTCTEIVTRHRCTKRPDFGPLDNGDTWECPDCGSIYVVATHSEYCPDCCGECGHVIQQKRWDLMLKGDRIDTAPRYKPQVFTPLRNVLGKTPPGDKPFKGLPPV